MKRIIILISLTLVFFVLEPLPVFLQIPFDNVSLKPELEIKKATCFGTSVSLNDLNHQSSIDDLIIIISHTNVLEKKHMGNRRLNNASVFLADKVNPQFGRSRQTIVTAAGAQVTGDGYLDFFVKGQLKLRIHLPKDRDLLVSPCVVEPEDKPCSGRFEKLFYPCKKLR